MKRKAICAAKGGQRGFTLIEVMVAMLIMGLIALLSWRALDSSTRAGEHLDRATNDMLALIHAFDQMERDVAWRTTTEVPDLRTAAGSGMLGIGVSVTPSILVQAGAQSAARIDIVRTSTTPGNWQRVQWWRSGTTLYRSAASPADAYPLPAPVPASAVPAVIDISGFEVRALQAGRGWVPLTAPVAPGSVLALEITILQGPPSGPLRYRRVLALR